MTLHVQSLAWDSEFFGFGVGRLIGSIESTAALSRALQDANEQGFRLVYRQCEHSDIVSHQRCLEIGGRFVDAKRTYSLSLVDVPPTSTMSAVLADSSPCSRRQLRSLAWQSAEFSRYRVDADMPRGSWRRMYSAWVENSLNGKLADAVLVVHVDENRERPIIGMITVSHSGTIGLLGVAERWRGRGIGRRLLQAAEYQCRMSGCTQLTVVTQSDNTPACRAYESVGYTLTDEQSIFHFWRPQS